MLKDNLMAREELREYMNSIYDLERLTMKVSYRSANPRDLISFKTSIQYLPYIKDILAQFSKGVLAKMAGDLEKIFMSYWRHQLRKTRQSQSRKAASSKKDLMRKLII